MRLVKLSCPNCGAKVEVNDELKKATCNYCGQPFAIDDEIIKVHHTVDLSSNEIDNALAYLEKFHEYNKAYALFNDLSQKYASNPIVWLGLLKSYTEDFTYFYNNDTEKNRLAIAANYYDKYIKTENNSKNKMKIYNLYLEYYNKWKEKEKKENIERRNIAIAIIIAAIIFIIIILNSE